MSFVPGRISVCFSDCPSPQDAEKLVAKVEGAKVMEYFQLIGVATASCTPGEEEKVIKELKKQKYVYSAEQQAA